MLANEGRLFRANRLGGDDVGARWLEARRHGVGGSDVAPIMGLSPWTSPLEVWLEKTGAVPAKDISHKEAVAMGTELEDTVFDMYRRRHPGRRAMRVNAILTSIERPWAQASLDGATIDPELGWGVLEIKTGSRESEWADGVPDHYLTQVTHYMAVTGWRFADVAALVGDHGLHYHEHRVLWDDGDVEVVTRAVDDFWLGYVMTGTMPALVTPLASEGRAVYAMHPEGDGEIADGDPDEVDGLARRMSEASSRIKELQDERTECSNALKRLIGTHRGVNGGAWQATWSRTERRDSGVRVREVSHLTPRGGGLEALAD